MTKKRNAVMICLLVLACITAAGYVWLSGSTRQEQGQVTAPTAASDTGFVVTEAGSFDSADTAVVVEKDEEKSTITFQNMEIGKQYTLEYSGVTAITDKYGESMSMAQIQAGDIADITFLKSKKKLNSLRMSAKCWTFTDVSKYTIDELRKHMIISEDVYKFSDDTIIVSDREQAEIIDINAADVLKVSGIGYNIYSIVVEKGHGYLRLANDEYFIGGWIEVGQSVIQQITDDMLLVVPEGSYDVHISNKGNAGTKQMVVRRDEEITLDIGDLKGEEAKFGTVLFTVSPEDTEIYIDGQLADISQAVSLEYGIHQLMAKADGYDTITRYLRVAQEAAGIDITMEKSDTDEEETETEKSSSTAGSSESSSESSTDSSESESESTSSSTVSGNSSTETTDGTYKVFIDEPIGAEVYVDGNYVGVIPCNFKKTAGSHVITLRRTGYMTRSYTVQLDEEEKDINYSFPELEDSE